MVRQFVCSKNNNNNDLLWHSNKAVFQSENTNAIITKLNLYTSNGIFKKIQNCELVLVNTYIQNYTILFLAESIKNVFVSLENCKY